MPVLGLAVSRTERGWSTDRAGQMMCLRHVSGAKTLALVQPSFERRIAEWGTGSYPGCLFERRELLGLQPPFVVRGINSNLFCQSYIDSSSSPLSTFIVDFILCETIIVVAILLAQACFTHTLARRRSSFIPLPSPVIVGVGHRLFRGRNRVLHFSGGPRISISRYGRGP